MIIPTIRIFVSSPGDVYDERQIAMQVIKRLKKKLAHRLNLESFFWESEPVLATGSFQEQIPRASTFDIFICILWYRIGTPLPANPPSS
jgi:hypothetical protein